VRNGIEGGDKVVLPSGELGTVACVYPPLEGVFPSGAVEVYTDAEGQDYGDFYDMSAVTVWQVPAD
jgi:hypothetical protein